MIEESPQVVVYVRNIKKGPIGAIRNALRHNLPIWALLGLRFIGGSVLEIIKDARQKPRLVATLQVIGVREIKEFNVFESAIRKKHNEEGEKQVKIRNIETTIGRVGACEKSSQSQAAKRWYQRTGEEAKHRLKSLRTVLSEELTADGTPQTKAGLD